MSDRDDGDPRVAEVRASLMTRYTTHEEEERFCMNFAVWGTAACVVIYGLVWFFGAVPARHASS
jgi:hypothetical protein